MCGILGAVGLRQHFASADYHRFVGQTDLVSYRGPDASGYLPFDTSAETVATPEKFDLFLGHRRLSIIDLSEAGRQPMHDGHGLWIIFNGEIFNYVELREELRALGHSFRTATDTEVIFRLYQQYGEAGFSRLNGMWAFALLDLPRHKLVLSRDRFSIKPLYYTWQDGQLYFGSEIKQLLPFLKERRLNKRVMGTFLVQAVADDSEETFFEGVNALRAKHNLVVDLRSADSCLAQYWEYAPGHGASGDDAIEQFRHLFTDSVRLRLRSDVPIGALVSGGLDSSAIAVIANRSLHVDLQTYSIVGADDGFSEESFIDVLAQAGVRNQKISFRSDSVLDYLDRALYHSDEPFLGFHVVAQYLMLEQLRKETDLTVILSGQGGDECLLGYNKFFFFHLQQLVSAGKIVEAFGAFCSSWLKGTVVRQFKFAEAQRYLPLRRSRPKQYVRVVAPLRQIGRGIGMRERQILDVDHYSVPVQTHFEDRNSMAHSLEIRTPFLDHRLVEFAINLPVSLKLRSGWTKFVLREAIAELPDAIRWRRDKQGFLTPEELWLRTSLKSPIKAMFQGSRLQSLGVIDDKQFLQYYEEFLGGDPSIWYADISRVFLAERWANSFLN